MVKWVESLFGEWTWTNSWWQLSLCSFVPAPIFTFLKLILFHSRFFFAKLSLLFYTPFKLKGCLFIHHICQFLKQNAKKQYLLVHRLVHRQKNSTASLKIARTATARVYNYVTDWHSQWQRQTMVVLVSDKMGLITKIAKKNYRNRHNYHKPSHKDGSIAIMFTKIATMITQIATMINKIAKISQT